MGNKKNDTTRATNSFQNLVADVALTKLQNQVMDRVNHSLNQMAGAVGNQLEWMQMRVICLERFLMEKLGVTEDDIADKLAGLEDETKGLSETQDGAKEGDFVRFTTMTTNMAENITKEPERMRIAAGGNVGIGTSTPSGKLSITSGDATTGLLVDQNGFCKKPYQCKR